MITRNAKPVDPLIYNEEIEGKFVRFMDALHGIFTNLDVIHKFNDKDAPDYWHTDRDTIMKTIGIKKYIWGLDQGIQYYEMRFNDAVTNHCNFNDVDDEVFRKNYTEMDTISYCELIDIDSENNEYYEYLKNKFIDVAKLFIITTGYGGNWDDINIEIEDNSTKYTAMLKMVSGIDIDLEMSIPNSVHDVFEPFYIQITAYNTNCV